MRETTSLVNESKICGRDEDKKAILDLLKDKANHAEVFVIPIIGMGGVGKTTLAQLVYNDPTLEFDLKAWVSVGEDFDIVRITKTVLLQLGDGSDDKDLNLLQVNLMQKLSGKKFLVVLDDVWTEKYEQWDLLRGPFEARAPQSRIIVTTRNQEVSLMMGTSPAYPLKELSYDECLCVFAQHALGATSFKEHLELKEMGEEIVKRCGGLPLAAKALGGILRALRLSYLHLPPHLKRCFAYCAILPKDREFDRHELVLLWMAKGFLCNQKKMKESEVNLQHLDIIGTTKLQEMPPHIGNLTSLRVLTKFVIGKGNEQITELKKLSDLQGQLHITSLENVEVQDIRDVGVANLKDKPGITELCLEWIDKFSSDLRNSSDEEQVLDSLRPHRRLSSLSITSFGGREFSSWLGEFSFSSMVQVKLSNCCQITSLPPLGRLKSLKKLSIESLSGVKEVGVEFYEDDSCFSCLEALEISNMGQWDLWAWHNGVGGDSVAKFPKLHELRIQSCPKLVGKLPTFLPSLEKLVISNCLLLVDLPAVLPSLKNIHISNCPHLVDLPEVLPSLVTLSIRRCREAVLRRVTNAASLISLKHLEIKGCNELVSWVDGKEGLLPCNLEILNVHVCPNLKELPSGLNNLKSLKDSSISQCGSLVSFPARGLPHSLIRLRIDSCDSLVS
ncbi:hypothetical protein GH714_017926 [Hevea brasiliensis]|uniref:Uncharacterized protein n=1 Tax=Hevea brasiliensis TaxID=3981 RepID=A0A6A6N672_HEVBR|nr:hypothetical protein GH714_017926 [Hevea brasiliensis]